MNADESVACHRCFIKFYIFGHKNHSNLGFSFGRSKQNVLFAKLHLVPLFIMCEVRMIMMLTILRLHDHLLPPYLYIGVCLLTYLPSHFGCVLVLCKSAPFNLLFNLLKCFCCFVFRAVRAVHTHPDFMALVGRYDFRSAFTFNVLPHGPPTYMTRGTNPNGTSAFRRSIYQRDLWARLQPDLTGRYRDCSPEFYT